MPGTMSASCSSDTVPYLQPSTSFSAYYTYLPKTLKPPENSPPALGSTGSGTEQHSCLAQGHFQSKQRGRANGARAADALQTHGSLSSCLLLFGSLERFHRPVLDQRLAVLPLASLDMSSRGCSHLPHLRHSKAPRHIIDSSAPFNPKASQLQSTMMNKERIQAW